MQDYPYPNEAGSMKKLTWTILLIFLLLAGPVAAQFYRYIDQNGNLRFTDDISKVPAEQRANIHEYCESEKSQAPSSRETVTKAARPPAEKAGANEVQANNVVSTGTDGAGSSEELRTRIEKMIGLLEAEHLALMKRQETIAKGRDSIKSREELAAYNKSVDAFNQRAENYEKMSSHLNELIDEYNALLPEKNSKSKKAN
jgi:hypothetical protein